jgi:DNA-binding CsgD family transcriptional regulator
LRPSHETSPDRTKKRADEPNERLAETFSNLASVLTGIGSSDFPAALARLLENASGYQSTVFAAFQENTRPVRLFSNLSAEEEIKTLQPYFDGTYLLDPWYNMANSEIEDGIYRLSECVPDGFRKSEYYVHYYAQTGLIDECGIFVRLSKQINIVGMLGIRSGSTLAPKKGRLGDLKAMFPAVRELVYKHWSGLSTIAPNSMENLQSMCRARGLVGREVEVTGHLLRGYSNKVIGRELGISHETVKVYRKRINRKLGTRSTREVYAMFFQKSF